MEKIEIEFSDMKIIEIEITFVYRNITSLFSRTIHEKVKQGKVWFEK
jgi:hypothetical protein